jgi:membrane protease YdiL (CAAX protease family)
VDTEGARPAQLPRDADANADEDAGASATASAQTARTAIWSSFFGIVVAVALVFFANGAFASGWVNDAHLQTLLAYGATWVPMLLAVGVFALARRGRQAHDPAGAQAILGIRFRAIDLLWGAAIGVLGRFVGAGMSLLLYGTTGFVGQPTIGGIDGWFVFGALIAPVVIAPLIEEGFFRGMMQGGLARQLGGVWAVGATAAVFTAVHLIGAASVTYALAVGVPLLVFAVAAGASRALTGRIGSAVIGHVVFNGVAALLIWPW